MKFTEAQLESAIIPLGTCLLGIQGRREGRQRAAFLEPYSKLSPNRHRVDSRE
jgi:hypothetical protein